MSQTLVHQLRHGKVQNPHDILYGRLPGYPQAASRRAMAAGADAVHFKPVDFYDVLDYRARVIRGGLLSVLRGYHPGDELDADGET